MESVKDRALMRGTLQVVTFASDCGGCSQIIFIGSIGLLGRVTRPEYPLSGAPRRPLRLVRIMLYACFSARRFSALTC